jgi:hypothetical protein
MHDVSLLVEKLEMAICKITDQAKSEQVGLNALQKAQAVQCLSQSRFNKCGKSDNLEMQGKLVSAVIKLTEMAAAAPASPTQQQFSQAAQCLSHSDMTMFDNKPTPAKKSN